MVAGAADIVTESGQRCAAGMIWEAGRSKQKQKEVLRSDLSYLGDCKEGLCSSPTSKRLCFEVI
jgi:hypothetical protein